MAKCVTYGLILAAASVGCSKPAPPQLTPKSASVSAISAEDVTLATVIEAYNPNAVAIAARSVTAKVTLDGKYDLGTITAGSAITLPPNARTDVSVPLRVKWADLATMATLAATNRPIPYAIDGSMSVGLSERISIDVPLHMTGTMSHDEIVQAALRSVPTLPGLPSLKDLGLTR